MSKQRTTEEAFRRLTLGDLSVLTGIEPVDIGEPSMMISGRPASMARIAALVALDAPEAAYRAELAREDATERLGLDELLVVLATVAEQVGTARVIAAAPRVAIAAGYDIDEALDRADEPWYERSDERGERVVGKRD